MAYLNLRKQLWYKKAKHPGHSSVQLISSSKILPKLSKQTMKVFISLLLLAVLAMIAVDAYVPPVQKPHPNAPKFPTFPGQGPFNPKIRPHRPRRSPQNNGQISVHGKKEGGKTSWNVEGQHKVWENKHGSIHISGGANKQPHGKPQGQVGIGGEFHWG